MFHSYQLSLKNYTHKPYRNGTKWYPFGMVMPDREYAAGEYKFGFNGKASDGELNIYDYGFRIYNSSIARFLSTDPLFMSYPWYSTYQFAGLKPIIAIDLDGLEENIVTIATVEVSAKLSEEWAETVLNKARRDFYIHKWGTPNPGLLKRVSLLFYFLTYTNDLGEGSDLNSYVWKKKYVENVPKEVVAHNTNEKFVNSQDETIKRLSTDPKDYSDDEIKRMRERVLSGKSDINDNLKYHLWFEEHGVKGNVGVSALKERLKYGKNWQEGSLSDAIDKFTPSTTPTLSKDGRKLNYESDKYLIKYDRVADYYTIKDKITGENLNPAGKAPEAQGINESDKAYDNRYKRETHIKNTDK